MPIRMVHGSSEEFAAQREALRVRRTMEAAVIIESVMPWSILALRGRAALDTLLALHDMGGRVGIERAARVFATCDADRDSMLIGSEVLAATGEVRKELETVEAAVPAHAPDTLTTAHFRDLCKEQLHELTLLRLLLSARPAAKATVTGLAAAAASRVRGGKA